MQLWDSQEAPDDAEGRIYYLVSDCPGISASAKSGTMWTMAGGIWKEYAGEIRVG